MRLGSALSTLGPATGPDALTRGAQRAEPLGYHSAGVADRLLGRLRDAGVTEVIVWTGGATLDGFLAGLERFREAAG